MSDPMDDLELPDFLNRMTNGIVADVQVTRAVRHQHKLVWPKKRNWRKIEARRREHEKKEGAALLAGSIRKQKGQ